MSTTAFTCLVLSFHFLCAVVAWFALKDAMR